MARRKKEITTPHPHRYRVTSNKSYIYVSGAKAAHLAKGKVECITWRCYVQVPELVEGKMGLVRKAIYGGTSDE